MNAIADGLVATVKDLGHQVGEHVGEVSADLGSCRSAVVVGRDWQVGDLTIGDRIDFVGDFVEGEQAGAQVEGFSQSKAGLDWREPWRTAWF